MQKRRVDWTFVFFYSFRLFAFPILAAQLSTNTCFLFRYRQIHWETLSGSALRNPMIAKREAKSRSRCVFYWGLKPDRFIDALWSPFGSLLLPFCFSFGSNWFPFARFPMTLRRQILPVLCLKVVAPKLPAPKGVGGRNIDQVGQ